jgi:hypothetical protein
LLAAVVIKETHLINHRKELESRLEEIGFFALQVEFKEL